MIPAALRLPDPGAAVRAFGASEGVHVTGSSATPAPYVYVLRCTVAAQADLAAWNAWYDDVHVPAMLSVPGIEGVTRYQQLAESRRFLAIYDVASPEVFDHPRYAQVRGWGPWSDSIAEWSRELFLRTPGFGNAQAPVQ